MKTEGPAERDRGAISIWFATAALAMTMLVGLAVDLGGQVHAQQRAHSLAAQAARTGAQQVAVQAAVRGQHAALDADAARAAAAAYLRTADVTGDARLTNSGTTLQVTTRDTYRTRFLGVIGLQSMTVTGSASARLVRSEGGVER